MQIIPVIDLMGSTVVHAQGGKSRADYPPLHSCLTPHNGLFEVISALQTFYPFDIIYIADLQAIDTGKNQLSLYQQLTLRFPKITFWIDAGIQDLRSVELLSQIENVVPVVGSETLVGIEQLAELRACRYVLSLDFRHSAIMGNQQILSAQLDWPDQVIVMDLDAVGRQQGPGFERLKIIINNCKNVAVIASGGVRDKADLMALQAIGVERALVASALHNGMLTQAILAEL